MLRSMNALAGYTVQTTDGELGTVGDILFDEKTWSIAYLILRIPDTPTGLKILPPTTMGRPDADRRVLPVAYSRAQIYKSPNVNLEEMVARHRMVDVSRHHGSDGEGLAMSEELASSLLENVETSVGASSLFDDDDPHLRSPRELLHFSVQALDGRLGHISDMILDDTQWTLHSMVVDPGQHVAIQHPLLISPGHIRSVIWAEARVEVDITLEHLALTAEQTRRTSGVLSSLLLRIV